MTMQINYNIFAKGIAGIYSKTTNSLQKSISKLSSGLRMSVTDFNDASGMEIAQQMTSKINGYAKAMAGGQDGISLLQTAEGALTEVDSMLQRMRELANQAANDTLTGQDRAYIQAEIEQLRNEIDRIGNTTRFNNKALLNGAAAALWSAIPKETQAIIKGSLKSIDQFGQKGAAEGNYNIKLLAAPPGEAEVQKSSVFKVSHHNVVVNETVNPEYGVSDIAVDDMPKGEFVISGIGSSPEPSSYSASVADYGFTVPIDTQILEGSSLFSGTILRDNYGFTGGYNYFMGKTMSFRCGDETLDVTFSMDYTEGYTSANSNHIISSIKHAIDNSQGTWSRALLEGINGPPANPNNHFRITIPNAFEEQTITAVTGGSNPLTQSEIDLLLGGRTAPDGTQYPLTSTFQETGRIAAIDDIMTFSVSANAAKNANILFETADYNIAQGTVSLKATANFIGVDGTVSSKTQIFTIKEGIETSLFDDELGINNFKIMLKPGMAGGFAYGGKFVYNVAADSAAGADTTIQIEAKTGTNNDTAVMTYGFKADAVENKNIRFNNFYLDTQNGSVKEGTIIASLNSNLSNLPSSEAVTLAEFGTIAFGEPAVGGVKLQDVDRFYDPDSGNFLLDEPQTIKITQGDGKTASVTLYASDTLDGVAKKINDAIANDLGQAKYVDSSSKDKFATFVDSAAEETSEAVAGTLLIRSAVSGSNGKLSFSGSEDMIKALGLNTIQEATESVYEAKITDAHSGAEITTATVTGNKLNGVLHENVDVEFDGMAGVIRTWDSDAKAYKYNASSYDTTVHLADNTLTLQMGISSNEDMFLSIGDMRSQALGIDKIHVMDRDSAAHALSVIDSAIDTVSTQRAKLGAYINRIEYNLDNMRIAENNMSSTESNIKDTDYAKEIMNFTKLQITLQANNAMLAQANQTQERVLDLLK